jgi:hypothetical protein
LGFIGLFYNPFLIFIALFVWIGAAAEAGMEQIKSTLSDAAAGRAMLTDFQVLSPADPLSRAIELTLVGSQKEFPVLVDAVMVGVLTQTELLKGLQAQGGQARVGDWMQPDHSPVTKWFCYGRARWLSMPSKRPSTERITSNR